MDFLGYGHVAHEEAQIAVPSDNSGERSPGLHESSPGIQRDWREWIGDNLKVQGSNQWE